MLASGYDAYAWCGLCRYKLMWAITSVNVDTDAQCDQGLTLSHTYNSYGYSERLVTGNFLFIFYCYKQTLA